MREADDEIREVDNEIGDTVVSVGDYTSCAAGNACRENKSYKNERDRRRD